MSHTSPSKISVHNTIGTTEPPAPLGFAPIAEEPPGRVFDGTRALVVVRESNMYEFMAFATMIRQVLEALIGFVPGVEEVLARCGDDALVMRQTGEAEALRQLWNARAVYQDRKPYGYIFEVQGTTFFFAMISAFSDSSNSSEAIDDLSNNFTDDLIGLAEQVRPTNLFTGPVTRVIRRKDLGEQVGRRLGLLKIMVHTKEMPNGINTLQDPGSSMWTMLCLQAEGDLRATVTRLLTGRIFHVRRNEWLAGPGALPLGFDIADGDIKRLVIGDVDSVKRARLLISLAGAAHDQIGRDLAAGEVSVDPAYIVQALSTKGATKRSNKKADKYGRQIAGAPLSTHSSPKSAVMSLLNTLDAYTSAGVVSRTQELPMTGLSRHDVHGATIYRSVDTDIADEHRSKGVILFQWTFPKPLDRKGREQMWATEDELAKAASYLDHLRSSAESTPSKVKIWPFAGQFKAVHNGIHFRFVHGSGGYQWRSSTDNGSDGQVVGKFSDELVAKRFVEALLVALEDDGIDPRTVMISKRRASTPAQPDAVAELEGKVADARLSFGRAQAAAREATSKLSRSDHQAEADRLATLVENLEHELFTAGAEATDVETALLEPDTLEVSTLATLLSVLLDTAGQPTDNAVCHLVAQTISSGTISGCWSDDAPWATFSCQVYVPTERGAGRYVTVEFDVGNTTQGPDRAAFPRRMQRVLDLRMSTSTPIEELAARLGAEPSPGHVINNLHDAFVPHFVTVGLPRVAASRAASAMVDCPIDSTRDAVWRTFTGQPMPDCVEDLTPAETMRHIEALSATYRSRDFVWNVRAWSSGGESQRREIVRWVAAHTANDAPDSGVPLPDLLRALGWKYSAGFAQRHIHNDLCPANDGLARLLERTTPWPSGSFINPAKGHRLASIPDADKRVRLRACPHCGYRDGLVPRPCPEFGLDPVACPACRLQPCDPTRKLPESYFLPWNGPFGRSPTDDRMAKRVGQSTGTRLGAAPAMLSPTRAKLARRRR